MKSEPEREQQHAGEVIADEDQDDRVGDGVVGGLAGIILGVSGAKILTLVAGWETSISIQSIILAFGFSVLIGLIFGIYPAKKASNLAPIDALRYE